MTSSQIKSGLSIIIGVLVTLSCLWLSFTHVKWLELIENIQLANPWLIVLASGIYLLSYGVRSFLWKELLGHEITLARPRLFQHLLLGVMANNVLPARLGEFVRTYMAAEDAKASKARVLSSIVVERCLDVFCLFVLTTIAFTQDFSQSWPLQVATLASILLVVMMATLIIVASKGLATASLLTRLVPGRFRSTFGYKLDQAITSFVMGLPTHESSTRYLSILGYDLCCWLGWACFLSVGLRAFEITIPWSGILMLTGIINLGVLAPSAPGFIGPFQFVCLQGLGLYGIGNEKALAFSIVFHASWYIPSTFLGLYFFSNFGLSWSRMKQFSKQTVSGPP